MYANLGLCYKYNSETETSYYYSDQMLKDGLLIEDSITLLEEDEEYLGLEQEISIRYLNSKSSHTFIIYCDKPLEPIRQYIIIKEIAHLYKSLPLDEFIEIISELCISYISSKMQGNKRQRDRLYSEAEEVFAFVRQ